MFKFPYKWLEKESDIPVNYEKLMKWLEEQGFEIESLEDIADDKLIEIEVKANRPDMLCLAGVLREYYASQNQRTYKSFEVNGTYYFSKNNSVHGHKILVNSKDVHRYYGLAISNVNNSVKTPEYITDVLNKLGIDSISPLVDISNYVMLLIGQPSHIFDADKLDGDLTVSSSTSEFKFKTLQGTESTFPSGSLLISDNSGVVAVAGLIGGKRVEVTKETKNIIVEVANFDHIPLRTASKKSHVSTLASYRYERKVAIQTALAGTKLIAKLIKEICGGDVNVNVFEYTDNSSDVFTQKLSVSKTNKILGTNLPKSQIIDNLKRCFFDVKEIDEDLLDVTNPPFRLDIEFDVDLIEEVGRIYGYNSIKPKVVSIGTTVIPNKIHLNTKKLRDILIGFGGIECLTYGFIPENANEILNIAKENTRFFSDIKILNPLSNLYSNMRGSMAYSIISTAINNIKFGIKRVNIFELGKTYFVDKSTDTGYNERYTLAGLLYGTNISKGFGIVRDNMYNIYDALALIHNLLDEFNVKCEIEKTNDLKLFRENSGAYIKLNGKLVGTIGIVCKDVLKNFGVEAFVVSDMLYYELDYNAFIDSKKVIENEKLFPSVKREYNFIVKNGTYFADFKKCILDAGKKVVSVKAIDVYTGKGVEKGTSSILVEVEFNSKTEIISLDEITEIEQKFYASLKEQYGITLKDF